MSLSTNTVQLSEREWFEEWFDSPYYHLLYRHRDLDEADRFIDRLTTHLRIPAGARVLDLACGRGRFSIHLAKEGFRVMGVDLSAQSIEKAQAFAHERLEFHTHDMRLPFRKEYFDYVFNFFTSFGYFHDEADELQTLQSVSANLKEEGIFALDFFNSNYVIQNLLGRETKTIGDLTFEIEKKIEGRQVTKDIRFEDQGQRHFFRERVRLFQYEDFERLFRAAGLSIFQTYGDYQLGAFDAQRSPRLILLAQKHG